MAGGEGTRLRPLTSNQPKPMVPIVGKPCMEHILELLRKHGFEDVIVTVAFMPQAIRSYFGDGEALGLNIEYSVEESPLGTAGSVRLAERPARRDVPRHLRRRALRRRPDRAGRRSTREKGAAVTIGLKSVENPLEFGIVVTDEDGRIERFLEKPSWGQVFSDTINTGIYVLEPEVLQPHPDRPAVRLLEGALPAPARDGPAAVRLRARRLLAGHRQPRPVPAGELRRARRAGAARTSPGSGCAGTSGSARAWRSTTSTRSRGRRYLGNYCRIAPDASVGAVLGARLERDAARARAHRALGHRRRARTSAAARWSRAPIVGRACDIRAHAHVHEGAAIGDEVTLGAQSVVLPGVRIYPYKEVETGAQIHESLIWESRASSHLFGKDGVSGLVNVDLTPETAVRLAAALGTALKRGARVVASRESPAACRMIKRAMISGLNSTGVDVADLRVLPASVSRHLLKTRGLRRRLPRRRQRQRPGGARDPLLRAARDPADGRAAEGDREALHAPRAAARGLQRASARSRIRPACARATRRTCSRASTRRRSARAGSGSSSTTATRPPRSSCRSCSARSASRRSARTASPRTARSRRPACARRSARRSGSSRRSAPTSASSSTGPASGCS